MKQFIQNNKVFILGLLASAAVTLQEFVSQPDVNYRVVGFAIIMSILSYLAKEWRGQGLSITGIVGNLAAVFITVHQTGEFTWMQFALQSIIAIIAASTPDPKSVGYERTIVIKQAKHIGEKLNPALLTKKPKL